MRVTLERWLPGFEQKWRFWSVLLVLALLGVAGGALLISVTLVDAVWILVLCVAALGGLVEPLLGIAIALLLGPLWAWLLIFPYAPPMVGQYIFLLTLALWFARKLLQRDLRLPTPPLLMPLLLFLGVTLCSLWNPSDVWVGFMEWAKWGQILFIFLLVADRIQEVQDSCYVLVVVGLLAFSALSQALLGLWQFALRGSGPDPFAINERFYRAYGTFQQPNPFAGFLGMLGALLLGIVLVVISEWVWKFLKERTSDWHLTWNWGLVALFAAAGCAAVIAAALGASWSRGAWMGFGAAVLAMLAFLPRRGIWGVLCVALLVVGGLGLYSAGLLPALIADRIGGFLEYVDFHDVRGVAVEPENYAVIERMAHWQAAVEMWREHFWLGVGFGCYEPAYTTYRLANWPRALGHAHNYYLNLLAEVGILGLSAYAFFFGSVFWGLWQALRRLEGWPRGLALGLLGAWAHFCTHSLVDNLLVNNVHLHFGVMLALTAWVIVQSRRAA